MPSYSPQRNPDERLNADLKHELGSREQVRTKNKRKQVTTAHMDMLENTPTRVRSYFQDHMANKYAA